MALKIFDTLAPQGNYPAVKAEHVQMPDGTPLSAFNPVFPVLPGEDVLQPETHYNFGSVTELSVTLAEKNDDKAHEYWFQFDPQDGFQGLTITPEVKWVNDPQYPVGKTCLVGIVMGMAVIAIV